MFKEKKKNSLLFFNIKTTIWIKGKCNIDVTHIEKHDTILSYKLLVRKYSNYIYLKKYIYVTITLGLNL